MRRMHQLVLGLAFSTLASAPLIAQQQKALNRDSLVEKLFKRSFASDRYKILMGTNPTDEQMAAIKKLVEGEREKITAINKEAGSNEWQAFRARKMFFMKQCDSIYALLTPEQQKVASPALKEAKAFYEKAANYEPTT